MVLVFLFRKSHINTRKNDSKFLFSPVFGVVQSVKKNIERENLDGKFTEVQIIIPYFMDMGIFLPSNAEVSEFKQEGKNPVWRYSHLSDLNSDNWRLHLGLKITDNNFIDLYFYKCKFALTPEIWILPGDKGSLGANIGLMPLGGMLVIYLPSNWNCLIKKDDQLLAGQSYLAKLVS